MVSQVVSQAAAALEDRRLQHEVFTALDRLLPEISEIQRLRATAHTTGGYAPSSGNAKLVDPLPKGCRLGDNRHAFIGGLRLWDEPPPAPALVQAA